ncbi:MAG: tripartite tricarboxylate transporter substrate binding protein [Alphaproteobacteria bacterium]|nr:tripartite tricarboxylate transporter substrate binding protein [Alphaproteobacteria bacterium]
MVRTLVAVLAAWLWLGAVVAGAAGSYPQHTIRLIVAFPPGGSSDAMARIVQPGLEKLLGQPIVIDNRPGAGGMIAIDLIAKAAPDGYTIAVGGAGGLGASFSQEKMSYDPVKDIAPVTGLAGSPFILAASPALKGKSLRDIIALAKQQDGAFSIGHGGNGTMMHMTSEMLNVKAGIHLALVPYRGMAPVVNDLIGGHLSLGIIDPPSGLAAIEAGTIAAIAVTSKARFPLLPDVPTFIEAGLPDFESNGWFGIVAPAATPVDVIATLNAAFVTVMKDPAVVERIRALGSEPMPMTPGEFSAFIRSEIDKRSKILEASGVKPN